MSLKTWLHAVKKPLTPWLRSMVGTKRWRGALAWGSSGRGLGLLLINSSSCCFPVVSVAEFSPAPYSSGGRFWMCRQVSSPGVWSIVTSTITLQ